MEKAKFTFSDGSGADEFFVLEETKINGSAYILVVDSEEDDAECLILREVEESKDAEKTYEIVEDDTELMAVSKVFEKLQTGILFSLLQKCQKKVWSSFYNIDRRQTDGSR